MAIHNNLTSLFSDIANSIRGKTGDINAIVADTFPNAIDSIDVGINIADSTLTENAQLLNGIIAYSADGTRHVGSQETVTHPAPSINKATFNTTSGNVEISANHVQTSGIVSGGTTSATTNVVIGVGAVTSTVTSHTATAPSVTVSHSGNIATIGTTTKPSGTAGTNYYQIGFSNSVTSGNTNARAYGNVSTNGYVTNLNNTASSWSNKSISATVTQPTTYYVNKGTLVASNISGAAFLENTGDYGFRATVEVPEGYHVGETVTKDFTTGIFPAPESKATADKMLTGYSLYDEDGRLITGNMPNQGTQTSTITTQGGTYTIPEGYHDGNGVVTASIGSGAYSATQVTAVSITPNVGGTITSIATTTQPSGTDGTDYYTIDPGATYINGNARSRINTAGYLGAGNKYVNITGSVGAGTNYYIPKSTSTNSSSVSGKTVTATVTIPAGYNPGETVTVSNDVAITTHPNPSINKATLNTTSGNVEITANHVQSTGYVTGGTTSASTNVSVGLGEINTPSATKAQSTPTFTWDATNRKLTASVAQTTATVYANTKTAGYVPTATRSGTVTMSASSNSYTIDAATINTPSGSAKQSKPGLSFNASNGVVTATVSATSGTAYANVTGAGYIGTGTKSGTFTMSASDSNTINVGLGSATTPATTVYTGTSTLTVNNSNGYVSAPSVSGTKSVTPTVSAGYVSSGTAGTITATFNASGLQLNTKAGGTTTVTTTETTLINAGQFATGAIKAKATAGAINAPSGTASSTIGSITLGYDSTNNLYNVTGSNDITGTAYRNITTAGYLATNTTSGTVSGTASLATTLPKTNITTAVSGTITRTAVITRRAITNTATLLDGAAGAQTTTAPTTGVYVAANTAKNTATATATVSKVTVGYSDGTNFGKTQGTKAGGAGASAMTYIPIKLGDITTTQGTASGATVTGYVEITNSGWINAQNISVSGTVASATRSAGSAAVLNNSNGNVRYYVNTTAGYTTANTQAYYLQLNTKAGGTTTVTTTETTLINAGQFAVGAIKAKATAGTLAAGTASVLNNSNGNIRYYRNVSTAGYIASNTTAYYLQLNTKAGSTTYVNGAGTTLVNAGQFVTGAIIAKAENATYNTSTAELVVPTNVIIIN